MRDIRRDLRQRLDSLRKERDGLQAQLDAKLVEIDGYEQHLAGLLDMEEKRLRGKKTQGKKPKENEKVEKNAKTQKANPEDQAAIAAFEADILRIIDDGEPWPHAKIKAAMERLEWTFDGSLGRAIHGTLLSLMQNHGKVESVGKGVWRKVRKAA